MSQDAAFCCSRLMSSYCRGAASDLEGLAMLCPLECLPMQYAKAPSVPDGTSGLAMP